MLGCAAASYAAGGCTSAYRVILDSLHLEINTQLKESSFDKLGEALFSFKYFYLAGEEEVHLIRVK